MITAGYIESNPTLFKVCAMCGNIHRIDSNAVCDCGSKDFLTDYKDVLEQIAELKRYWVTEEKEMSNEAFDCMEIVM